MSTFNGGDEWVASWKVESLNFDIDTTGKLLFTYFSTWNGGTCPKIHHQLQAATGWDNLWTNTLILVWLEVTIYVHA